ncbi:unnamed protein product, partial [Adineta steineri]
LIGQFNPVSHEWSDGVLAVNHRKFVVSTTPDRKWLLFDSGGRNAVTARFLHHFNTLGMNEFDDKVLTTIFTKIMESHISTKNFNNQFKLVIPMVVQPTLNIYKAALGLALSDPESCPDPGAMKGNWTHEILRVFYDRRLDVEKSGTISEDDLRSLMYCDFGDPKNDQERYLEVTSLEQVRTVSETYLEESNEMSKKPISLVLFRFAIEHVSRVSRIIEQPRSHALLVGVGGSSRQSVTRLAAHMSEMNTFQVEISKSYTTNEWREDLKRTLRKATETDNRLVFLFCDTQIKDESFLEDANNLLNSSKVPNLFPADEKQTFVIKGFIHCLTIETKRKIASMTSKYEEACRTDQDRSISNSTKASPVIADLLHDEEENHATLISSEAREKLSPIRNLGECRFDTNCTREDCFYDHPNGRLIDQTDADNLPNELSDAELITSIEDILSNASTIMSSKRSQQRKTTVENNDNNESDESGDEEPILDIVKDNIMEELYSQHDEFSNAVISLDKKLQLEKDNYQILRNIYKQLKRELKRWETSLPIYSRRTEITELMRKNQILVLQADTGAGKSTQIVQYLCDEGFADKKQILCTQPRKIAACTLARRVAQEYGCSLGDEVGFYVGGRRPESISNKTKIKFITDTLFLKEYRRDPLLQDYSVVIIDEAHERKIDTDLAFGIMKLCLKQRNDLKLIVMSATLDTDLLYNYFSKGFLNSCGVLKIAGRNYPIEDIYLEDDVENYVHASVAKAVEIHQKKEPGDILVFLTGQDEIDLAINELKQKLVNDKDYVALSLHNRISPQQSVDIFKKIPDKRKIIFSTNVAETSVTIDGIKHVIETGMVKEKMWDEKRKMQVLKTGPITKSSVKQRRGRAGRTSSGICHHLYTVATYESMNTSSRAEILCTQPILAILKLKNLGIFNTESFDWLEAPSTSNLQEAHQTLILLKAINEEGELTNLGNDMAYLGIDPKLTAMLSKAKQLECLSEVLIIAGMLTVSQNIWWRRKGEAAKHGALAARGKLSHESGDHITLLIIYQFWKQFGDNAKKEQYDWCTSRFINAKSLKIADEFIEENSKLMDHSLVVNENLDQGLADRILQCLTTGFFHNLAISNGSLRAGYQVVPQFPLTSTDRLTVRVSSMSALATNDQMPQYILYNELVNLNGINYITTLSKLDLKWLQSVSQEWYDGVNISISNRTPYENFTFTNLTNVLIRAVAGKHNCKINMINEAIQGAVDINYSDPQLTIWCQKSNLDNAKEIIQEMIEREKEKLSNEQEEIQVVGRTRIVMGNGGECKMILVENEFIRIIAARLPSKITEQRVKNLCSSYGHVRDISFLQQTSDGVSAAITYATPNAAQDALRQLNHHIEEGRQISVGGSYLKSDVFIGKQNCSLKAIWYLTPSLRNGKVVFTDQNDAFNAYKFFKESFYECRYEAPDDLPQIQIIYYRGCVVRGEIYFSTTEQVQTVVKEMQNKTLNSIKLTYARGKNAKDDSFVKITRLPIDVDEEDLRNHFQSYDGIVDVIVIRQPNIEKFDVNDAKDQIQKIFKEYPSFKKDDSITIKNFPQEKTVAYGTFTDEDELRLAIEKMNGKTDIIGRGKVRLSRCDQRKKKKNEHVIQLQNLNRSWDKYNIIELLKQHQLYNYVKSVSIGRQKFTKKITSTSQERQQIGFDDFQKKFEENTNFRSKPTYHIQKTTSDGIVTIFISFDNPADVVIAIEKFNNTEVRWCNGKSNLRIIPSMAHEILVHPALVKAIPNYIKEAVECVKEEFHNILHIKYNISETNTGIMKITVDGDDIEQIRKAKIQFDNILKGTEYILNDNPEKVSDPYID